MSAAYVRRVGWWGFRSLLPPPPRQRDCAPSVPQFSRRGAGAETSAKITKLKGKIGYRAELGGGGVRLSRLQNEGCVDCGPNFEKWRAESWPEIQQNIVQCYCAWISCVDCFPGSKNNAFPKIPLGLWTCVDFLQLENIVFHIILGWKNQRKIHAVFTQVFTQVSTQVFTDVFTHVFVQVCIDFSA